MHLAAATAMVTECINDAQEDVPGPNNVDTVSGHLIVAEDTTKALSKLLSSVH